ncbi:MAG: dockerin type I domain-containing protein [Candidatus Methanoperedens sp.]|nr:hypothetical protein [Nitrospirota bacterium]
MFNNSVPRFADKNISFVVAGKEYVNGTANSTGFISFTYTGAWSEHTFEWQIIPPRYDVNRDGIVDAVDLNMVGQNFSVVTNAPYPYYDVDENGVVNVLDLNVVGQKLGEETI